MFSIMHVLLQTKVARGWPQMVMTSSQQCMRYSCPKCTVRHNPYLGMLLPYRKVSKIPSFLQCTGHLLSQQWICQLSPRVGCRHLIMGYRNICASAQSNEEEGLASIIRSVPFIRAMLGGVSSCMVAMASFSLEADVADG